MTAERNAACAVAYDITVAVPGDVPDIVELQRLNLVANGGMLSVEFPQHWFESTLAEMPIIVARSRGRLVGYLVSSTPASTRNMPVSQAKFTAYPARRNSYNYGPICISANERGRGLAALMFQHLRAILPGREGVAFIRADNAASRSAHASLGFLEVAKFSHDGGDYVVVTYTH